MNITETPAPTLETPTVEQMEEALAVLQAVRAEAARGIDTSLPWKKAHAMMRLMSPQQYGNQMERWVCGRYGWEQVHKSLRRGDCVDSSGDHWEIKASFVNSPRFRVTFGQIRPLEDVAGYQMFVVSPEGDLYRFVLTSEQMKKELALRGFCTHGKTTKEALDAGAEQSLHFTWRETDETYIRWMREYRNLDVPS